MLTFVYLKTQKYTQKKNKINVEIWILSGAMNVLII